MTYVWDTNILLLSVRDDSFIDRLNEQYEFFNPSNESLVSAVTVGEIRSIAYRNNWGEKRLQKLNQYLKMLRTVPVTDEDEFIRMYVEIDAYSQSHHSTLRLPTSARKMGKNDLWIAATAAVYNATLISTDADFDHLDGLFLYFEKIVA